MSAGTVQSSNAMNTTVDHSTARRKVSSPIKFSLILPSYALKQAKQAELPTPCSPFHYTPVSII